MGVTCGEEETGERRDKVRVTHSVAVQQNLRSGEDGWFGRAGDTV